MIGRTFGRRGGGGSGGGRWSQAPNGRNLATKVTTIIHTNFGHGIQVIKKHRKQVSGDSAFRYRVPLPVRAGIRVQRGRGFRFAEKQREKIYVPGRGQVADAGARRI